MLSRYASGLPANPPKALADAVANASAQLKEVADQLATW